MIVNVNGRYTRRKVVALLVCFFVAANSLQGTVLCFGADGHIEFESAFHEQCADHDHSLPADHDGHSSESGHDEGKHCHQGQCVDIPVDVGMAKISVTSEQLDRDLAAIGADVIVAIEQPGRLEISLASTTLFPAPYFDPLRTIVLLA